MLRVIVTGVSSFTGAWIAAELARDGHRVIGTLQRSISHYPDLVARRFAMAQAHGVELIEQVSYGSSSFASLLARGCDVLCYHGADVRDYRSPDFDVQRAVAANLAGFAETCRDALAAGAGRLIYTGSVGEPGEGGGTEPGRALSPYGLSKGLTWQAIERETACAGLKLGKFVVPNPFGMLEQERFCTYLVHAWKRREVPQVRTPDYLRDNIPINKLARAYADLVARPDLARWAPSGYVETQGEFTARFAREIGARLALPTPFTMAEQTDFSEPMIRINSDPQVSAWDETAFWDALAADYAERVLRDP